MENENIIELQEMREQIALLKDKLSREQIVTDELMRNVIRQRMNVISNNGILEYCCVFFVITFGSMVFWHMTQSMTFVVTTIIYMLICAAATIWTNTYARKRDVNGDLLTVAKNIKKVKKIYQNWLWFAFPSMILWAGWLVYLVSQNNPDGEAKTLILCMLIGLVTGSIIGLFMHRRVVNACDDIIRQIEK